MRNNSLLSLVQTIVLVVVILSATFLVVSIESQETLRVGGSLGISAVENFTVVVLPDTQYYSSFPDVFDNQTQWIVDNVQDLNMVFVTHEGDIIQYDTL